MDRGSAWPNSMLMVITRTGSDPGLGVSPKYDGSWTTTSATVRMPASADADPVPAPPQHHEGQRRGQHQVWRRNDREHREVAGQRRVPRGERCAGEQEQEQTRNDADNSARGVQWSPSIVSFLLCTWPLDRLPDATVGPRGALGWRAVNHPRVQHDTSAGTHACIDGAGACGWVKRLNGIVRVHISYLGPVRCGYRDGRTVVAASIDDRGWRIRVAVRFWHHRAEECSISTGGPQWGRASCRNEVRLPVDR